MPLPVRCDTDSTLEPTHVPVRLGSSGDLARVVGAELPDRVDLHEGAHEGQDAEDHEEEATGLGGIHREQRVAHDVLLRPSGARVLGVLVVHDQGEVRGHQAQQQGRDQQDVHHVETGHDRGAGELAVEDEELNPRAHQRDGTHQTVGEAETGAREQVVRQRVSGEALNHGQHEEPQADQPVDLTRLAEGTREEDAQHVDGGCCHEEDGCPVVDLADQ